MTICFPGPYLPGRARRISDLASSELLLFILKCISLQVTIASWRSHQPNETKLVGKTDFHLINKAWTLLTYITRLVWGRQWDLLHLAPRFTFPSFKEKRRDTPNRSSIPCLQITFTAFSKNNGVPDLAHPSMSKSSRIACRREVCKNRNHIKCNVGLDVHTSRS